MQPESLCLTVTETSSKERKWWYTVWIFTVNSTKDPVVWYNTFQLNGKKSWQNMDLEILDELYKWLPLVFIFLIFFAPFLLFIWWEAVHFSSSLFCFFCLQMVGAVHRKDCGRRLDTSRFSHCCQRHLRLNASVIPQNMFKCSNEQVERTTV